MKKTDMIKEQFMSISRLANIAAVIGGIFILTAISAADEATETKGITWVEYDEGLKLGAKMDKIIFIDFYTDWCKFCHKMDRETFSDKEVIDYFAKNFVAVKINAESKTKIKLPEGEFNGRELARQYGVRGYPTYWFLKPNGERINYISSYLPPDRFMPILKFVGEGHHENMTYKEYLENSAKKQ